MLRRNVAIVWRGLANTGSAMLRYVELNCCNRSTRASVRLFVFTHDSTVPLVDREAGDESRQPHPLIGLFSLSISGKTDGLMIYVTRKRARADNLTIFHNKETDRSYISFSYKELDVCIGGYYFDIV